jgi:phenylpropionate dioxygenase-like ring-hydroxylating dioxygenase large terminal subunit
MEATLPWAWYVDPEILRREQERIFRSAWSYVGHAGQLERDGDWITATIGLTPLVVVRGDGELRAFLNVCRHRGFPVARGESGNGRTLQCGYHAWTYDLDGSLRAAPRSDREPDFDRGELGLVVARVGSWGPFVFASGDPQAPPLEEALGELPELVRGVGLDVDALRFHRRWHGEVDANWKVICENFLECYHCPTAHPGFSAVVDVSPDAYRLETAGALSSQYGPLRERGAGAWTDGEIERGQFHFLWPNLTVNIFPGRPNISIGPVNPLGPRRSTRFLDYFFAPDAGDDWIAQLLEFDDEVGREDRVLVEGVQRGMDAGVLEHGRVMGESEQLIRHFQGLTLAALA